MCSFLVTNKKINNIENVNFFMQKRGPDETNIVEYNGIYFLHNLLSLTGEKTPQPIFNNNTLLVYNGEIYNFKNYSNDTKFLLDCYIENGCNMYNKIDGEYALVIVDFNKNKIIFSGDIFLTKPIFYCIENNRFGISSYESALTALGFNQVQRLAPNYYYELSLKSYDIIKNEIHKFNLIQNIDSYELWNNAFNHALVKRTANVKSKIVVPMSSGHDSGCIVCGLSNINYKNYITYTFTDNENSEILNSRLNLIKEKIIKTKLPLNEFKNIKTDIEKNVERFYYGYSYETRHDIGFNDDAAVGLYKILKDCTKYDSKVLLSGQGGDEIYGNNQEYGFANKFNPTIFPDNLENIFPWANFFNGGNYSYLTKEEYIAGSLGYEARYPLLDKDVVQQFLNLTSKLKNKFYKGPITNYLIQNNFPYFSGKSGFKISKFKTNYLNKVSKYANIDIAK